MTKYVSIHTALATRLDFVHQSKLYPKHVVPTQSLAYSLNILKALLLEDKHLVFTKLYKT